MRVTTARAGLSLLEVLVAAALATIIVGVVVQASTQVQGAINASQARLVSLAEIRSTFVDIEQDLARMIPSDAPAPFASEHPLQLETAGALPPQPNDPTGLVRYGDKLRVFSSIYAQDPATAALQAKRAIIDCSLESGSTAGTPTFVPLSTVGFSVGRLRRRILKEAGTDQATTSLDAIPAASATSWPIFVDRVVSFSIEWIDSKGGDLGVPATFQVPTATTQDGSEFSLSGQLVINKTPPTTTDETATSNGAAQDDKLLTAVPLGGEIKLSNSDFAGPTRFLVRRRTNVTGSPPNITVKEVLLNDHVFIERNLGVAKNPVAATAFYPPSVIRVSLVVAFGKTADSGTARFSKVFQITR